MYIIMHSVSFPLSRVCTLTIKYVGVLYTSETTGNKSTPLTQLAHPVPLIPRPSYQYKPLRAYIHDQPTVKKTQIAFLPNYILLCNGNKSFSSHCLFLTPPPHSTVIQEFTRPQNMGLGAVPTDCIRNFRLLPTCY